MVANGASQPAAKVHAIAYPPVQRTASVYDRGAEDNNRRGMSKSATCGKTSCNLDEDCCSSIRHNCATRKEPRLDGIGVRVLAGIKMAQW